MVVLITVVTWKPDYRERVNMLRNALSKYEGSSNAFWLGFPHSNLRPSSLLGTLLKDQT